MVKNDECQKPSSEEPLDLERESNQIPSLSFESQSTKNDLRAMCCDSVSRPAISDCVSSETENTSALFGHLFEGVRNRSSVLEWSQSEEARGFLTTGSLTIPRTVSPILVSTTTRIEVVSVEHGDESSFNSVAAATVQGGSQSVIESEQAGQGKENQQQDIQAANRFISVPDAVNQRVGKDITDPELLSSLVQSVHGTRETKQGKKNQLREIQKASRSTALHSIFCSKGIILMLLVCQIGYVVGGKGVSFFGIGVCSVKLNCQVPPSVMPTWLQGISTVRKNGTQGSIDENQNLIIMDSVQIKDFDCEIRMTSDVWLRRFHLSALNICALPENQSHVDFIMGKKEAHVELTEIGSEKVTVQYRIRMQNDTLEIFSDEKAGRTLKLSGLKCVVTFKENDTNASDRPPAEEKSSNNFTIIGLTCFGFAVALTVLICLGIWLLIRRRMTDHNQDKAAVALNGSPKKCVI